MAKGSRSPQDLSLLNLIYIFEFLYQCLLVIQLNQYSPSSVSVRYVTEYSGNVSVWLYLKCAKNISIVKILFKNYMAALDAK